MYLMDGSNRADESPTIADVVSGRVASRKSRIDLFIVLFIICCASRIAVCRVLLRWPKRACLAARAAAQPHQHLLRKPFALAPAPLVVGLEAL